MTGYTVHTGSTIKFSSGWDRVFEETPSNKKRTEAKPAKAVKAGKANKKSVKKPAIKAAQTSSSRIAKKKAVPKSGKRSK